MTVAVRVRAERVRRMPARGTRVAMASHWEEVGAVVKVVLLILPGRLVVLLAASVLGCRCCC